MSPSFTLQSFGLCSTAGQPGGSCAASKGWGDVPGAGGMSLGLGAIPGDALQCSSISRHGQPVLLEAAQDSERSDVIWFRSDLVQVR